jgi:hypothetical protein
MWTSYEPDPRSGQAKPFNSTSISQFPASPEYGRHGEINLQMPSQRIAPKATTMSANQSLNKDAPFHRAIQRLGAITSQPVLGGLHHQYCRI